ncbi:MAG: DUF4255 domain-containing protein [Patulibacter minatonensis]
MSVVVPVAAISVLSDVDDALRELLGRGFAHHRIEPVDLSFERPTSEWDAARTGPALSICLYDLRGADDARERTVEAGRGPDRRPQSGRAPLRLECSYAVTAWSDRAAHEHALLSQALAILFAFPRLPEEVLPPSLLDIARRYPLTTRIAQPRSPADVASRPSLDVAVTVTIEPGTAPPAFVASQGNVVHMRDFEPAVPPVGDPEPIEPAGPEPDA